MLVVCCRSGKIRNTMYAICTHFGELWVVQMGTAVCHFVQLRVPITAIWASTTSQKRLAFMNSGYKRLRGRGFRWPLTPRYAADISLVIKLPLPCRCVLAANSIPLLFEWNTLTLTKHGLVFGSAELDRQQIRNMARSHRRTSKVPYQWSWLLAVPCVLIGSSSYVEGSRGAEAAAPNTSHTKQLWTAADCFITRRHTVLDQVRNLQ